MALCYAYWPTRLRWLQPLTMNAQRRLRDTRRHRRAADHRIRHFLLRIIAGAAEKLHTTLATNSISRLLFTRDAGPRPAA